MTRETSRTVVDFDGTISNLLEEGASFEGEFQEEFTQMTGLSSDEVQRIWDPQKAAILKNPEDYGWRNKQGLIVAPASADMYIMSSVIVQLLLDKMLHDPATLGLSKSEVLAKKIPTDPAILATQLDAAFMRCYEKLPTVLQEGALEFLSEVDAVSRVTIVGNAGKEKLLKKLATLKGAPDIPVIGRAWKQEVDPSWEGTPESMRVDGLKRPVWLRRRQFNEALTKAGALDKGVRSCAIGDIWELDLALPEHLGLNVGLMQRNTTPGYEVAHLKKLQMQGRATIARTLGELLPQILGFFSQQ